MRAALSLLLLVSVLSTTRFAKADPGSDPAPTNPEEGDLAQRQRAAQSAMQRGVSLFGRGDAQHALEEYERAKQLVPAANLPYRYAGEALVALDRKREALANFEAYLAKSPNVSDAPEVRERVAQLRRETLPSRIALSVRNANGARAFLDDTQITLPSEHELLPGQHSVRVTRDGFQPLRKTFTVAGGETQSLELTLESIVTEAKTPWPTLGYVGLGVGVGLLGLGVASDLTLLQTRRNDLEQASSRNDAALADYQSRVSSLRTGVVAAYVSGALVALTGAALLLFAPRTQRSMASKRDAVLQLQF
jgi:tetratricopeptide (TPR) repeat protein